MIDPSSLNAAVRPSSEFELPNSTDNWTVNVINLADDRCQHDRAIHVLDAVLCNVFLSPEASITIIEVVAGRLDRDLAVCSERRVAP